MSSTTASEPTRRKRRGVLGWIFTVLGIVVAFALIVGGYYVWTLWSTASHVQRSTSLLPTNTEGRPAEDAAVEGSFNYVLMGSDSRGEDQGRSDVLMLAHVPPTHDKVYIVSFPRDMWVNIPGRGYDKINAAYAYGGEQLATRTLESMVGVRMDHAVKIDFEGFKGLTTALGGVTVNNPVASTSGKQSEGSYTWPAGEITLQGEEALSFVQQRYELPNGDLDRAARQRAMVKAILKKMLTLDVLANPAKFNEVVGTLGQYFTVDETLTNEVMFTTATGMRINSGDDIVLLQAPITGFGTSPAGASIDLVNEPQLAEMAQAVRTGKMADYYAKYGNQPLVPKR